MILFLTLDNIFCETILKLVFLLIRDGSDGKWDRKGMIGSVLL